MKRTVLLIIIFLVFLGQSLAQVNSKQVYVKGYTRKDGTYVNPHYRTAPNSTNRDNFSTRGNINPYTGKPGYIPRDNKPLERNSVNSSSTSRGTPLPQNSDYRKDTNNSTSEHYKYTNSTYRISNDITQQKWIRKKLIKKLNSYLDKEKNYNLKIKSRSKRQMRWQKRNLNIRIFYLLDGWYNVNYLTTIDIGKRTKNVFVKRQILIENGKATKYIGAENMIFDIHEIFLNGNNYKMKIVYPDNEVSKVYGDILFYETKPLIEEPYYTLPQVLYFYSSKNNHGGPISVTVESDTKIHWGGYLDKYWTKQPTCSITQDIIKFYLPTGEYRYLAENNSNLWNGDVRINTSCIGINLSEK